jgi:hypothetical protein
MRPRCGTSRSRVSRERPEANRAPLPRTDMTKHAGTSALGRKNDARAPLGKEEARANGSLSFIGSRYTKSPLTSMPLPARPVVACTNESGICTQNRSKVTLCNRDSSPWGLWNSESSSLHESCFQEEATGRAERVPRPL